MKNKKISIVAASVLLSFISFNVVAQDPVVGDKKDDTPKSEVEKIEEKLSVSNFNNFSNSLQKSNYRNEASALNVQEQLLDRQISVKTKILENKKLDYMLNLPIEAHIDTSKFKNVLEEKPKGYRISEDSMTFKEYVPTTYEIDQLIFSERKKEKVVVNDVDFDVNTSQRNNNQNNLTYTTPQNNQVVNLSGGTIDLSSYNDVVLDFGSETQSSEEIGLTDAELRALGITREEYNAWISTPEISSDVAEAEFDPSKTEKEEVIEEPEEFMDIKNFVVSKIIIFGDNKKADIGMDFYVGDGIVGDETTRSYSNVREGEIISFNDYQVLVTRIDKTEVEIELKSNGKKFVATTTYK